MALAKLHSWGSLNSFPSKTVIPDSNDYPFLPTFFSSILLPTICLLCHQISSPTILTQSSYTLSHLQITLQQYSTLLWLFSSLDSDNCWIPSSNKHIQTDRCSILFFFLTKNIWNLVRFLTIFVKMNKCRITRWSFHSTVNIVKALKVFKRNLLIFFSWSSFFLSSLLCLE